MNGNETCVSTLRELRAVRHKNSERMLLLRSRIVERCAMLKREFSVSSYIIRKIREFMQ